MADDLPDIADTAIKYADDGSPAVPTDPALAAARLRALDADPTIYDAITDIRHPQHADRLMERRALLLVAHGKPVF